MAVSEIVQVALTVIASLGGGGVIVVGLSNWLGKVWAERLMQRERQEHAIQLESLRDSLRRDTDKELAFIRSQLDFAKEAYVKEHLDRVMIYRAGIDMITEISAKALIIIKQERLKLSIDEMKDFEYQRLRMYAYLAIHATQSVMDAHDALMDKAILPVIYDNKQVTWNEFRDLAINLLNEIRKDIGIRPEPIAYKGIR